MTDVTSIVFRTLQFPHLGKIVTINLLDFCTVDVTTPMENNIPMLGQFPPPYHSIGVGMLKEFSLMGILPSAPSSIETKTVNMISSFGYDPKGKQVVDSPSHSLHEAVYDAIQSISNAHTDDLHLVASDPYHLPYLLEPSLPTLDYLSQTFMFDDSIMEIMSTNESVWEDHHHRSSFLPNTSLVDNDFVSLLGIDIVDTPQTLVLLQYF